MYPGKGLLLCIRVKRQCNRQSVHVKIWALRKHSTFLIRTQWSNICNVKNIEPTYPQYKSSILQILEDLMFIILLIKKKKISNI